MRTRKKSTFARAREVAPVFAVVGTGIVGVFVAMNLMAISAPVAVARSYPPTASPAPSFPGSPSALPLASTTALVTTPRPAPLPGKEMEIAVWIKVVCALTMAAGTSVGGWRIIKTLGHKMVKLHPINGFAAETASATVILAATHLGIPVSTTHNISAAIMGVGAARRLSAIKWTVVEQMVWAWILTIPVAGLLAYGLVRLLRVLF